MRKILLAIVLLPFFAYSQTITDTATIRSRVNSQIVPNGTQAITGAMLNNILNGYLNAWPDNRINANYPISWNPTTRTLSLVGSQTGVPTSRKVTINGIQQDLSADRIWSVGTLTSIGAGYGLGNGLEGPITNSGTLFVDTSLISSKAYSLNVYNTIRSRFSALSPIAYDVTTGQFSLNTIPISKGGTGLTAVGTNGQVIRSNGTGLYYFTPNWLTGSDTISLSNRINAAGTNLTFNYPLYRTGTNVYIDFQVPTYNARWLQGTLLKPGQPPLNGQTIIFDSLYQYAQWGYINGDGHMFIETDSLALHTNITNNQGFGMIITGAASQALGTPPVWTYAVDTTIIPTKTWVSSQITNVPGNSNVGSGNRWLKPATQGIKTAFGINGVLIDSTTNTDALTFQVDSTIYATKGFVDSIANNLPSGGGTVTGFNGLTTVGTDSVKIGGTMTENTTIDGTVDEFNMDWIRMGHFNVQTDYFDGFYGHKTQSISQNNGQIFLSSNIVDGSLNTIKKANLTLTNDGGYNAYFDLKVDSVSNYITEVRGDSSDLHLLANGVNLHVPTKARTGSSAQDRFIPISVNGNYADSAGNIVVTTGGTTTGTVTSVATNDGTGITGGTITTTGTLSIDTSSTISTKANVTKIYDLLNNSKGTSNTNVGSSYRWLIPGSQAIKTFHPGYGFLLDSTSYSNELTGTVDTANVATINYVTNVYNILSNNKQTKLTSLGSGYKILDINNQGIKSLKAGLYIGLDSATTGEIKINADTATMGPWVRTQVSGGGGGSSVDTLRKDLTLEFTTASENFGWFYTTRPYTIKDFEYAVIGSGAPSVTFNVAYEDDRGGTNKTNIFASDELVNGSTGAIFSKNPTSNPTEFSVTTIPKGKWVILTTSATAGTINNFNIHLTAY